MLSRPRLCQHVALVRPGPRKHGTQRQPPNFPETAPKIVWCYRSPRWPREIDTMSVLPCPPFESVEPRPPVSPSLLSRPERERIVERGFRSLYRWYVSRSQAVRNWNPDRSFNWPALRKDHSDNLRTILQGFYAVEQFAPDYTAELTRLTRRS